MSQKNVLILGGSSDIGVASIKLFLKNGWKVTAHYNSKKITTAVFNNDKKNISKFKFDLKKIKECEKCLKKNEKILDTFEGVKINKILEIGAGSGRTSEAILSIKKDTKYIICDIHPAIYITYKRLKIAIHNKKI